MAADPDLQLAGGTMKRICLILALGAVLVFVNSASMAQEQKGAEEAGQELRNMILSVSPDRLGLKPDTAFPKVYGLLMDWNIGEKTASILALKDGTASLYTTSSFGIIGGQGNERVRVAAERCARLAGAYYYKGRPVSAFPYPGPGQVNFFLLTYQGTRLCIADERMLKKGRDPYSPLFAAAQIVLTEMRRANEDHMR